MIKMAFLVYLSLCFSVLFSAPQNRKLKETNRALKSALHSLTANSNEVSVGAAIACPSADTWHHTWRMTSTEGCEHWWTNYDWGASENCANCRDDPDMAGKCAHTCCKHCKGSCTCRSGSTCTTSTAAGWEGGRKYCYLDGGLMGQYCDGAELSGNGNYYYSSVACDNCVTKDGYKVSFDKACAARNELGHTQKSLDECAAACDADDTCVAFERSTNDFKSDCYLSNSCDASVLTTYDGYCHYNKKSCPHVAGYIARKDKACSGKNELGTHVATRAECAAHCTNNHLCVSFEMTTLLGDNQCWLSSSCTSDDLTDYNGYCNYEKRCETLPGYVLHPDRACYGKNELTQSSHHGIMTLEQCANFCKMAPSCISFEWWEEGQYCYRSETCIGDALVDYTGFCLYIKLPDVPYTIIRDHGCVQRPEEIAPGLELLVSTSISDPVCAELTRSDRGCSNKFMNNGVRCACVRKGISWCTPNPGDGYNYGMIKDWKTHQDKTCYLGQGTFMGTVEAAKNECLKQVSCGGVAESECHGGSGEVEFCLRDTNLPLGLQTLPSACVYEKPRYNFHVRWIPVAHKVLDIHSREVEIDTRATSASEVTLTEEIVESYFEEASKLQSNTDEVNAGIEIDFFSAGASASQTTEETNTQAQEFQKALISSITNSYQQEWSTKTTITTPSTLETGFMDYTVWCFQIDAQSLEGGSRITTYDRNSCRTKWGCGRDKPPNCLPGKCLHEDQLNCEKCIGPEYVINANFYNAQCDPYVKSDSKGSCPEQRRITDATDCYKASDVHYGTWAGEAAVIDRKDQTCGCFIDEDNKRYFNAYNYPCDHWKAGETLICLSDELCGGELKFKEFDTIPSEWKCPIFGDGQSIEVEVAAENARLKEVNRALKKALDEFES